MGLKLTKQELRDLKRHGYEITKLEAPNEQEIGHLIVISNGNKELHDSGYPYIKIIGVVKGETNKTKKRFVNLGWHDHFLLLTHANVDSLGKNIFRVMHWETAKPWKVQQGFMSLSTFMIGSFYPNSEDKYVWLS